MDTTIQLILLAILQGVAEFLPISSSGHLVLAQSLLGLKSPGITLEVVLHAGTLISTLLYYRKTIFTIVTDLLKGNKEQIRLVVCMILSAIPAILFYVTCKKSVEQTFESPKLVGAALLFTGCVLLFLRWIPVRDQGITIGRSIFIGIAQAIAILPGVSRSGMTISAARLSGMSGEKSAEFSFLASIPLIAGACLKKAVEAWGEPAGASSTSLSPLLMCVGICVSAVVGYLALSLLVHILRGRYFWCFGIYCLLAGAGTLLFAP